MGDFTFRFGRGQKTFVRRLRNIGTVLDTPSLWDDIGSNAVAILKNNMIRVKKDPKTAQQWQNLTLTSSVLRFNRGTLNKGLLIDSGTMFESITHNVNKKSVSIFSDDDPRKVAAHNNGDRNHKVFGRRVGSGVLPQRRFISTSPEIEKMAVDKIEEQIRKETR
ncbi:MAG: hypothetical protein HOG49_21620 [Candidatus Scalindua sp.]|jgi:hypothetical protein|nr:hypothetical protein [Candidatus Scalindua sp.]